MTDITSADTRLLAALNATVPPQSGAPDLSYWDDVTIANMRAVLRAADEASVSSDARLDALEQLADELDDLGAGTSEYAAPEVIGAGAEAIRDLIAEVRSLCRTISTVHASQTRIGADVGP